MILSKNWKFKKEQHLFKIIAVTSADKIVRPPWYIVYIPCCSSMDSLDIINFRNRVLANFDVGIPLIQLMDQNQTLGDLIKKLDLKETFV